MHFIYHTRRYSIKPTYVVFVVEVGSVSGLAIKINRFFVGISYLGNVPSQSAEAQS